MDFSKMKKKKENRVKKEKKVGVETVKKRLEIILRVFYQKIWWVVRVNSCTVYTLGRREEEWVKERKGRKEERGREQRKSTWWEEKGKERERTSVNVVNTVSGEKRGRKGKEEGEKGKKKERKGREGVYT